MAKLIFDAPSEHLYQTGISDVALFVMENGAYKKGVAWNGVTALTESPSGAESTALYADNIKYLNLTSAEDFGATIEAYNKPIEFGACDGEVNVGGLTFGQQTRNTFALVYKTIVGNDEKSNDYGYKLHIIYGCKAAPSERSYSTMNDSPEAISFSWELTTTPVDAAGYKSAHLEIDTTRIDATKKAAFQGVLDMLYGSATSDPTLMMPEAIVSVLKV